MLSDPINTAIWIVATVAFIGAIAQCVRIDKAERLRESELDDRMADSIDRVADLRDAYIERGKTIDTTQFAVEKWKRRAAQKTAEVHHYRRLLRGLDVKETRAEQ